MGESLTGGNYDGAKKVGTIEYQSGVSMYVFSGLKVSGSSVQIQGDDAEVSLAEVQVYEGAGQ